MDVSKIAKLTKQASQKLRQASEDQRIASLHALADCLEANIARIMAANELDLAAGKENNLSSALLDRLELNTDRIKAMAKGVREIASQPRVVGEIVSETKRNDGLLIQKQRVPLGVIAMIFESRPNVVIDCSALAIKSGNGIILKGGKEAAASNAVLGEIVGEAIRNHIPKEAVAVIDSKDRAAVATLLTLKDNIDVIIPRGGEGLINMVYDNAKMPVIAHFRGLCHVYVDNSANLDQALAICINAKAQRPGVCNAAESILVHRDLPSEFLQKLVERLQKEKIEVRGDDFMQQFDGVVVAKEDDWDEEYLDRIVSIKSVTDVQNAIDHITTHGTFHTEVICAEDKDAIETFVNGVDASCVAINASSRFNDGGQLGLGAELGISTTKLHAYGPMGVAEMTTLRFVVTGDGHIRS